MIAPISLQVIGASIGSVGITVGVIVQAAGVAIVSISIYSVGIAISVRIRAVDVGIIQVSICPVGIAIVEVSICPVGIANSIRVCIVGSVGYSGAVNSSSGNGLLPIRGGSIRGGSGRVISDISCPITRTIVRPTHIF
ncbi:MAG TPA: hypothetical protein V6D33_12155 [Cyanophyceae cyanobacterium]